MPICLNNASSDHTRNIGDFSVSLLPNRRKPAASPHQVFAYNLFRFLGRPLVERFLEGSFTFQVQRVPLITLRAESQLSVLGVPSSLLSHSGRAMDLA